MIKIPVLRIGPVLIVTIQTELHDRTAEELQETILNRISETGATGVLIDISVVEMVDSFIARILSETARMTRLLNAKVVLVGMRPAVTMTLLEMGLNLPGTEAAITLEKGLKKLGLELQAVDGMEDDLATMIPGGEGVGDGGD